MEQIRIKVKTEVLEARASAAEEKIRNVRRRFERIGESVRQSVNYWEGEASEAHRREYQEYEDDISKLLSGFQESVTDLRKIAGIYREAQEEAAALSQSLPADVII